MKEMNVEWIDDAVGRIRVSALPRDLIDRAEYVFVQEKKGVIERGVICEGIYIYERRFV